MVEKQSGVQIGETCLLENKPTNFAIPLATRPHNENVAGTDRSATAFGNYRYVRYWCIRDPGFASFQDKTPIRFFRTRFHAGRVRSMVGFR